MDRATERRNDGGRRPWWGAGLALSMLVAVLAGYLLASSLSTPGTSTLQAESGLHMGLSLALSLALAGLVLLACLALGWQLGVRMTRQGLAEPLREARSQTQALSQLLDAWQWQTDAQHHLVRWQAPHGAPASSWIGAAATQMLWERFALLGPGMDRSASVSANLKVRLDEHAPLQDVLVWAESDDAAVAQFSGCWSLRGVPCFDATGRFKGYFGTARAIQSSATTSAEPGLERAAAATPRLQAAAGAATVESESLMTSSDQEAFNYTVSHDLRAPVRVVDGFARILKEDYGRQLDRIGNDHLDRIMGAAARMNNMIDALLSLAQLSSQPLTRQPVNLSQLARYVFDDLQRSTPERQVEVHVMPAMQVQGDPTLLRVVLENLLGNAWKYSAKCERSQIRFEYGLFDGRESYLVGDNGAGFDMRYADRLFGVFQRLHSASDFQGTGVGLASVRRIIRRHGGDIWAESQPGQGARFYFTLAKTGTTQAAPAPGPSGKV